MESSKFENAVNELRVKSLALGFPLQFKIITGSMRFLLSPGDEVLVKQVAPGEIDRGDIVVWKARTPVSSLPVVHRVVARKQDANGFVFRTRGDFNDCPDTGWVGAADIIGKVLRVRKKRFGFSVDRGAGRIISRLVARVSLTLVACRQSVPLLLQAAKSVLPEGGYVVTSGKLLFCTTAKLRAEDWQASVQSATEYIGGLDDLRGARVADVQCGGGFSEEAFCFMRKGCAVEGVDIAAGGAWPPDAYDFIVIGRIVEAIPAGEERRRVYRQARAALVHGGRLVLSCIDGDTQGAVLRLKRRVYAALPGNRYRGPLPGDVVADGQLVRRRVTLEELRNDMARASLTVVRAAARQRALHLVALKQSEMK